MSIVVRHIERTCLEHKPFLAVTEKYFQSEKNLLVVFDLRLKDCFGSYIEDTKIKTHVIRISPLLHMYEDCDIRQPIDSESQKYKLLSTFLHEVKHVKQKEDLGSNTFYSNAFCRNKSLKNSMPKYYYSPAELDARTFEYAEILNAVEVYNKNK